MMKQGFNNDRWWERFWKYKTKSNNQHDWYMNWADIKLSGNTKSVFHIMNKTVINDELSNGEQS